MERATTEQLRLFDQRATEINKTLRLREKEVKRLWGVDAVKDTWPANKVLAKLKPPQTPWEVQDEDDAWPEEWTRRVPDTFQARVQGRNTYDEQFSDLMKRVPLLLDVGPHRKANNRKAGKARRPPAALSPTRGPEIVTVHVMSASSSRNRTGDKEFRMRLERDESLAALLQDVVPFEKWSAVTSICPENVRMVPQFRWNRTSVLQDGVDQINGWRDQVLALDASAWAAAAREHNRNHSFRYVVEDWEPTCHLYLYIIDGAR